MLSGKRDISAVKRFFKKVMRAAYRRLPFTISVDKHASYPDAFTASQEERVLPQDCKLRRVKYLNNIIEQGHLLSEGDGGHVSVSARFTLPSER
jgi:IS6 family transposase